MYNTEKRITETLGLLDEVFGKGNLAEVRCIGATRAPCLLRCFHLG